MDLRHTSGGDPCVVVGVDMGGTFIDYCAVGRSGEVRTHKQLTDRGDVPAGLLKGLRRVAPDGADRVVHGTTLATNALLERRGARTGLLATAGFADVLAIGRQNRPQLYALAPHRRQALVPRSLRREAAERVDATGAVLQPLDPTSVGAAVRHFEREKVEAVAVCFLFSFLRPEHERAAAELIRRALPDVFVCISSDVLPEYREYERTATSVATAYVGPLIDQYMREVAADVPGEVQVMQSNGGVISAEEAAPRSAHLVLSGPAGGVVGGLATARGAGISRILTLDMGGTSTDVALCPGEIPTTVEASVGDIPIRLPMIDIHTIGAGGGSVARLDRAGALRVGPESAGADPGPACYGRGGTSPCVTDADVVLGRIPESGLLGGYLPLDRDRACSAVSALAAQLGMELEEAALGILQVVHASMQRAVRRVSVERGHDPREFTLVAYGGAGPIHAVALAEELGVSRLLIPRFPGVASAAGMAAASEVRDYSRTVLAALDAELERGGLDGLWAPLEERARRHAGATLSRSADLRYRGQSFEIEVPADDLDALGRHFADAHQRRYGFVQPDRPIELVNVRLEARRPRPVAMGVPPPRPGRSPTTTRVRFDREWVDTVVVGRDGVGVAERIDGPALITQPDTATVIPPRWSATADDHGNLVIEPAR